MSDEISVEELLANFEFSDREFYNDNPLDVLEVTTRLPNGKIHWYKKHIPTDIIFFEVILDEHFKYLERHRFEVGSDWQYFRQTLDIQINDKSMIIVHKPFMGRVYIDYHIEPSEGHHVVTRQYFLPSKEYEDSWWLNTNTYLNGKHINSVRLTDEDSWKLMMDEYNKALAKVDNTDKRIRTEFHKLNKYVLNGG